MAAVSKILSIETWWRLCNLIKLVYEWNVWVTQIERKMSAEGAFVSPGKEAPVRASASRPLKQMVGGVDVIIQYNFPSEPS